MDDSEDRVLLMTLHSAKGLEFPFVYMSGMEDGLFPSALSLSEDEEAVEEERRLCYVGITRAEKRLTMTAARQRMTRGEVRMNRISRFVDEIPEELLDREEQEDSVYAGRRTAKNSPYGSSLSWEQQGESGLPWERSRGVSVFGSKPSFGKAFTVQKADSLAYGEGDRVRHRKFGEGTVLKIADGGKDYEVTVEFDQVGVRKMYASFADLKKTEKS